jgi:hypothetical protein
MMHPDRVRPSRQISDGSGITTARLHHRGHPFGPAQPYIGLPEFSELEGGTDVARNVAGKALGP